jgi:hypothetical protein
MLTHTPDMAMKMDDSATTSSSEFATTRRQPETLDVSMKNTENTQYFASDMKISGFKFNGAPVSGL